MLWGFSPAVDFMEIIHKMSRSEEKEVNVLIVGAADPRHILQTIAKSYTHDVVVNFYVIEVVLDFIARQLMLITLALEPPEMMSSVQKVRMWCEVYGNALLTPQACEYVVKKATQWVHMVTDREFLQKRIPCIDLDEMKYKEKDGLESTFKFWAQNDFKIGRNWDERLRKSLGTRYDAKEGAFDWDFHMKFKPIALRLNEYEYKQWRNNGVAFNWLEREYVVPNPTFAMGVHSFGDQFRSFGFLGDMEIGPFLTFGHNCEDDDMLGRSKVHDVPLKRATDITERNLTRIFHEMHQRVPYQCTHPPGRDLGSVVIAINPLSLENPTIHIKSDKTKEIYSMLPTRHRIKFLTTNALELLPQKSKFKHFFDAAFFASNINNKITPSVVSMLKNGAPVIMETQKPFFMLSKESHLEFERNVKTLMENSKCVEFGKSDFQQDFTVVYQVQRQ